MLLQRSVGVIGVLLLIVGVSAAAAQDVQKTSEDAKMMQRMGAVMVAINRLSSSSKLTKDLELTPDQLQKIQIAAQKTQDKMMEAQRSSPGSYDPKKFADYGKKMMSEIESVLSDKQNAKFSREIDQRVEKQKNVIPDPDQMKEMQRLNQMMMQLQRLAYDINLAKELEITSEQRVRIREASQTFSRAMQERARAREGESFDMDAYNQLMGDLLMEAQDILTPEQSKKLSTTAKLNGLKQIHGDEFAMIIGLAEDFDLDAKAKAELKKTVEAARDEYYERLSDLKDDTLETIVGELPSEHRDEVREAVKRFFEVDPRKKRGFGGR